MTYFFGRIEERNGEQEYALPIVFQAKDENEARDVLDRIASGWYTHPDEPGDGESRYYFSGGALAAEADTCQEVPEEHYEVLKQYLSELSAPKFVLTDGESSEEYPTVQEAFAARKKKDIPDDWEVENASH
jgi:hypothetical protein